MAHAILLSMTIVSTATLIVMGALSIFAGLWRGKPRVDMSLAGSDHDAVFIFRGEALIDSSDGAQKLLATLRDPAQPAPRNGGWAVLQPYLKQHFAELETALSTLADKGQCELKSQTNSGLVLSARYHKGLTQLRLSDTNAEGALLAIDRLSFDAVQSELTTLRALSRNTPALVWKTDAEGQVVWANAAYIRALQEDSAQSGELCWPLPHLFDMAARDNVGRLELRRNDGTRWFAHSEARCEDKILHFALPIDAAVQSEASRRETLQTLTRTFASLPIGLALFDSERRLQVFNPALVDLTGMAPLFLAARPSFEQVLYTLREKRMLPEPKDFQNWRREIIEMEKAAEDGVYAEEWCLDGGRTFHVTGRPQPNGAIALFIEDVTTETALTRSFRAEIETMQKVIDGLGDAVAVFSRAGQTLLANDPYVRLWEVNPCVDLGDGGLTQALGLWSETCEPTTLWARLAEFVTRAEVSEEIKGSVAMRGGNTFAIKATRLPGGAVMIVFRALAQAVVTSPRTERALQAELINGPDLARQESEAARAVPAPERPRAEMSPRKPRSAVHSSTRMRV
ncbi:MAG: hypothetical protein EA339_03880 [Rhodobacteraceae bacterium]|nr:MAG: hypothetical protein EA339_03880 [Paracoccaceae bacterium]